MDDDFTADSHNLHYALSLLLKTQQAHGDHQELPDELPEAGRGSRKTVELLAPDVLGRATGLGGVTSMAHMDPPTPWITWAMALWNASLNQNLLHPATAPVARAIEERAVAWLAPFFGMQGGHMLPGSTIANLTALWAARECAGVEEVVVAESAHVSIRKSAHILGLRLHSLPCTLTGALRPDVLPADLSRAAVVLTAGATSTGAIDDLTIVGRAAWTHVDAAWAGPLRLSPQHATKLDGIEGADSIAVSAHKWLFQPKESALVLFRDVVKAHAALSFGGAYLAAPNVGVLGSHGAVAVPLLATLLAWGREGVACRIERCMDAADQLASFVAGEPRLQLLAAPETGVVVWRTSNETLTDQLYSLLPANSTSLTTIGGARWLRNVAANPNIDIEKFTRSIDEALSATFS